MLSKYIFLPKVDESSANMKNHIIFATNFKIFFYDYITDGIRQINEAEIEKKNIKRVFFYQFRFVLIHKQKSVLV